jgi:hypothetical protein
MMLAMLKVRYTMEWETTKQTTALIWIMLVIESYCLCCFYEGNLVVQKSRIPEADGDSMRHLSGKPHYNITNSENLQRRMSFHYFQMTKT